MNKHKILWGIIIISILLTTYFYILSIQSIPDNIIIFEGESINIKTLLGLKAKLTEKDQIIETLSRTQTNTINTASCKIKFIRKYIFKRCKCRCITKNKSNSSRKYCRNKVIHKWSACSRNVRNRRNRQ